MAALSTGSTHLQTLLSDHDIELRGTIGTGSYSKVRLGYSARLDQVVAVKVIDTTSKSEYVRRFLPREIEMVRQLRHENVVHVYEVVRADHLILLVEEYGGNGDLLKRIKERTKIPEDEATHFFRQLIEALEYLRASSIVHRDIKCENVFLDSNDNVKLGDFGFARYLREGEQSATFCGSKAYVAPEILTGTSYTGVTVDVWSAGVVLYIMLTGVMPYDDRHPKKMLENMLSHRIRFPRNTSISMEARTLIYDILHPQPASRLTYPQMKSSLWLEGIPCTMRTVPFPHDDPLPL